MSKISAGLNIVAIMIVALSSLFYWHGDYIGAGYRVEVAIFFAVMASNLKGESD
jgi:hypothetical protein